MNNNKAAEEKGVFGRSIQGGKWMVYSAITQKALSIVTFFILARLLAPGDYGIMAIIFMVINFFQYFTEHGFEQALIQRQKNIEGFLNEVWTLNVLKSFLIFGLIYWLAGPISGFFHAPEAASVIRWAGLLAVVSGLTNIRQLFFFKELDFSKVFWRDLAGQICYTAVTLSWAIFIQASFWALFAGQVARLLAMTIMTYVLDPVLPRLSFHFKRLRGLLAYSKWVFARSIVNYGLGVVDNVYVGRLLDASSLGFYSKGKDLSVVAASPLLNIMNKVSFSSYSLLQDEPGKVKAGLVKTLDILFLLAVPVSLVLLLEGGALVSFFLGQRWLGIVAPLKILSIAMIIENFGRFWEPIFDGLGRPAVNFKGNVIQLLLSLVSLYFGIKYAGLKGAAFALLAVEVVIMLYMAWQGRKILRAGPERLMPSIVATGIAGAVVLALDMVLRLSLHSRFSDLALVGWSAFLGTVYLAVLWLLGAYFTSGPRQTLLTVIRELRGRT